MGGSSPKTSLGRSLGALMQGRKPAEPPPSSPVGVQAKLSPGMATLLRGANGNGNVENTKEEAHETPPLQPQAESSQSPSQAQVREVLAVDPMLFLLRATLVMADVLLCVLAAYIVYALRPLGFWSAALCAVAILFGAWLSWLALKLRL